MSNSFSTERFAFDYLESDIENTVLWESHCHSQYETVAVLEGRVNIMIEGRSYALKAGQAVIISPLSYHTVTASKKGVYKRVTALFDSEAIPPALSECLKREKLSVPIFSSGVIDELKRVCLATDKRFYAPLAESLMVRLMYDCVEYGAQNTSEDMNETLYRVISYIDAHLEEKIKLEDLAAYTARSKSSVCHLFEERMKISPKQYILQKKLALAVRLIRDGMPPTLAAIKIGYDNYSDFYRMYRKHIKNKPSGDKNAK